MNNAPARMFCKSCEYTLAGVSGGVCPECGRAFDLSDPNSYDIKPKKHLLKWTRRAAWVIGIIAAAWLLAPSRVAKLTWSWPNPDGVTATSETRWCLVAPRWLPIPYPRWSAPRWQKPVESGGLLCADCQFWQVRPLSVRMEMHFLALIPRGKGARTVGWYGDASKYPEDFGMCILPQNIDKLCDWALDPPSNRMGFSPHELRE